jgi:RNA polymerase sigma-70 factor (ECF subfamily)
VRDNYDRLIRLAGLVCRNTADAEDAVQGALERAWRNQAALRDPDRVKPWLDRIVVREAIRITRSREGLVGRLLRRSDDEIEIAVDPVDPHSADAARMAELRAAFERLSAEQRAVVALHLYAGYSVAETADIVGTPLETVRSRLRLARQRLRIELDPT